MPNGQKQKERVCFRVNEHGWILLSELLGKIILRAHKVRDKGRTSDPDTQHRAFEFEFNKSVKIKSKLFDTSGFIER